MCTSIINRIIICDQIFFLIYNIFFWREKNLLEQFDFIIDENESNNKINNNLFTYIENKSDNKEKENKI